MNGLILYNAPRENIYEERLRQIDNIESITKNIMRSTGYNVFRWGKYESGDPTLQTFYRVLKAEKMDENGDRKKAEIKVPVYMNGAYLINGNRYIPIFQISDVPVFKRSNDYLMLYNTYCTIVLSSDLTCVKISKNEWPTILVLLASGTISVDPYNKEGIKLTLCSTYDVYLSDEEYGPFLKPFKDDPDRLNTLNEKQSKLLTIQEGLESLLKNWNSSTKIDKVLNVAKLTDYVMVPNGIFNQPFTMLDLIHHIFTHYHEYTEWPIRDINDISKRRVRLSEWVCYKLAQQYKINYTKNSTSIYANALIDVLNLDQRRILDDSVNPLGELCMHSRINYNGPGGITKESCSVLVRNIHESYRGIIDPIDTPTGQAVGISQHLVPDISIDKGLLVKSKSNSILSSASQTIPLLQHDDGIRVEMACNQSRQSISLVDPEIPLVKSGNESLYTNYTSSLKIAKDNGFVMYKDDKLLVIKYDRYDGEVIDITSRSFTDFDKTLITTLNTGDKFKKGDTLACTKSIDPKTHELRLGKNMLVGFMSLDGWNFEDAVVVSESAAKKLSYICTYKGSLDLDGNSMFSLSSDEYIPIPPNGSDVTEGDVIMRLGKVSTDTLESITPELKDILAPMSGKFYYDTYFQHDTSTHVQMSQWIKNETAKEEERESKLKDVFKFLDDSQKYISLYCWLQNRKKIHDDTGVIQYTIKTEKPLRLGCKLSNRHGNKGTISIIMPDDKMPTLPDGRHLDIVLNPLGIITRMNVGQLYELHLTWFMDQFINHLKEEIKDMDDYSAYVSDKVIQFISIIDNTKDKMYTESSREYINEHPEVIEDILKNGLQIIQPPFESCASEQLEELRKFADTDYETDVTYEGKTHKASVGWMYMMRLHHEPDHKIFGRSLGIYGKHDQPPSGADAHRLGEMEVWALMAYEANDTLKEFLSVKSDNPSERKRFFDYLYDGKEELYIPENLDTVTKETFKTYLKGCGLNVEI